LKLSVSLTHALTNPVSLMSGKKAKEEGKRNDRRRKSDQTMESLVEPIKMTNISKLRFTDASHLRPPPLECSDDSLWSYYSEYIKTSNESGADFSIDGDIHVFRNRLLAEHLLIKGELKAKYSEGMTIAVDHNSGGVVYASMDADDVMKRVKLDQVPPLIICLGEPIRRCERTPFLIILEPSARARSIVVHHSSTPMVNHRRQSLYSLTLAVLRPGCSRGRRTHLLPKMKTMEVLDALWEHDLLFMDTSIWMVCGLESTISSAMRHWEWMFFADMLV